MFTSIRPLRSTLPAALLALSSLTLFSVQRAASQENTVIQHPYAIGRLHARTKPYSFTGRLFDNDNIAFGSATLIRRHTLLTAAHVIYEPTTGFSAGLTFSRALYGNFTLSKSQIVATNVLSGYQLAAADAGSGIETLESGARDLGYCVTTDAPVDDDWGTYLADPSLLTDNSGRFILGYPGVTFNGRTMAYTVPTGSFVEVGAVNSGYFQNEEFITEPGNSGGPVYAVPSGTEDQIIVGELVAGLDDPTAEFNAGYIRAITTEADQFLTSAEYTTGLIKRVRIRGPRTVTRGQTVIFKLAPIFTVPSQFNGATSTTRYKELALTSDNAGTPTTPFVTITKINNRKFSAVFSTRLRPNTTVTLTAGYAIPSTATGTLAPGTSADNITIVPNSTLQLKLQ